MCHPRRPREPADCKRLVGCHAPTRLLELSRVGLAGREETEAPVSDEHKSALVILGTRTGFLHILKIPDWRHSHFGELKRVGRFGRHMHSVHHHLTHHPQEAQEANAEELLQQIRIYSHAKHLAKSLHHDENDQVSCGCHGSP